MKKCAIIIRLTKEAEARSNEELRKTIKDALDRLITPAVPFMANVVEVAVWSEP